ESVDSDDGRRRPDLIVQLPGDRTIVIDAKVPLTGYMEAMASDDQELRRQHLEQYAACVRSHMEELSKKAYWDQFDHAPEFVVMFLPAESFFSAALDGEPGLLEEGALQRVIIATPTTLIALLKVVALGWREERITENTEQISALGKELYDRLRVLGAHFAEVGTHLGKSVMAFNKATASLEHRVLISARRFDGLGAATGDPIEELSYVDTTPNALSAPEFELLPSTSGPSVATDEHARPLAS